MLFKSFIAVAAIMMMVANGSHAINVVMPIASKRGKQNNNKAKQATIQTLAYAGGSVKNNVDVQPLLWPNPALGSNGAVAYASKIVQFYKGITNSTYFDWLSECKC